MSTPGAQMLTAAPQLEKDAFASDVSVAPTVMQAGDAAGTQAQLVARQPAHATRRQFRISSREPGGCQHGIGASFIG